MAETPSGSGSGTPISKAIPSLARKQSDVTRQGTGKLKFVPTLPQRRKKEEVKTEPAVDEVLPCSPSQSTRGRGTRGGRGDGRGRGRGRGGGPPEVMTASGPFAMGPTMAGSAATRRSTPRSNFAPSIASSASGSSTLGAGLSQTAPATLKRDLLDPKGKGKEIKTEDNEEVYSDPDDGVEIIDMENVRGMDYMAPESLRRERTSKKIKKEKKTEDLPADVDAANVLDLSESEDEEEAELEDVIEDFATQVNIETENELREEKIYLFQFPAPFPSFVSSDSDIEMSDSTKKVTFGPDVKPPAPASSTADKSKPKQPLDGVIGRLEVYRSGAVKIRLASDILLDVNPATQPSFLQQVVHVDLQEKRINVLGEINKQFIASPNVEALLEALEQADKNASLPAIEGEEKLISMN